MAVKFCGQCGIHTDHVDGECTVCLSSQNMLAEALQPDREVRHHPEELEPGLEAHSRVPSRRPANFGPQD